MFLFFIIHCLKKSFSGSEKLLIIEISEIAYKYAMISKL